MTEIGGHGAVSHRPTAPMRFADPTTLDKEFTQAGFHPVDGHNQLGHINFDLGPVAGDSAWMSAMLGKLKSLQEMATSGQPAIRERTKSAVKRVAQGRGLIKHGNMTLPGTFRTFCLRKTP